MQIRVKYAIDSDPLTLEVSPLDTIGHVKSMLRDFTPKIFSGQDLLVCSNGDYPPMVDSRTIGSIQQNGDSALLFWFCGSGSFSIDVYNHVSECFSLKVDSFVKVGAIKAQIERNTGQAPEDQRPVHYGRLLDDDSKPLLAYDIVKPFGNMTAPSLVLQDVDEIFSDEDEPLSPQIPSDAQIHAFRSRMGQVFRDTIHGIRAADPVDRRRQEAVSLHVHLTFSDTSVYIDVLLSNTIDELKFIVGRRTGYHTDCFALLLDGTLLDDGNCTLEQCGFKDKDLCQAYKKEPERIRVRAPSEPGVCPVPQFMIMVTPLETVRVTKEKIAEITGIPPEEQCLKYRGLLLDGDEDLLLTYIDFRFIATASLDNAIILIPPPLDRLATKTVNSLSSSASSSSCY